MPPSPVQAAYWQHRGDLTLLFGAVWLLAAILCWTWSRRLRPAVGQGLPPDPVERALALRARWLRAFLLVMVGVALFTAFSSAFVGCAEWREASRYRPHSRFPVRKNGGRTGQSGYIRGVTAAPPRRY